MPTRPTEEGAATGDDLDALAHALVEADEALRALYRELAEDPDRAGAHVPKIAELHARR